jgi:hypothetical protein
LKCQDWWERNCLYLSPEASTAFTKAFSAVHAHPELRKTRDAGAVESNWGIVKAAGDAIREGANLPSLGGADLPRIPGFYQVEAKATQGAPPTR